MQRSEASKSGKHSWWEAMQGPDDRGPRLLPLGPGEGREGLTQTAGTC